VFSDSRQVRISKAQQSIGLLLQNASGAAGGEKGNDSILLSSHCALWLTTITGFGPWQAPKLFEAVALADYAAGTTSSQARLKQTIHDVTVGPGLDW
jgi:hypothetical protein